MSTQFFDWGLLMKKVLIILLALSIAACVFTGCQNQQAEETSALSGGTIIRRNSQILGTISDDGSYFNEFLSLGFTLPEGWVFADQAELDMMMGGSIGSTYGGDDDDESALIEYSFNSTIYDMMASNPVTAESVVVMFVNTARFSGGVGMSEEDYLSALKENLSANEDMPYVIGDTEEKTIAGTDYMAMEAEIAGKGVYQSYYIRRVDKYMVCLCFSGARAEPGSIIGEYFTNGDTVH